MSYVIEILVNKKLFFFNFLLEPNEFVYDHNCSSFREITTSTKVLIYVTCIKIKGQYCICLLQFAIILILSF